MQQKSAPWKRPLRLQSTKMEEAEKEYKDKEEDVNAQARRVLLKKR